MNTHHLYQHFLKTPKVTTDTRKDVKNSIFFALSGEQFNGNKFAEKAIQNGANFAVIDDPKYNLGNKYILVDDTLTALQELATIHRKRHLIPLVAITGSNGKTTTKELMAAVLGSSKNIIYTQGNFNNHIGVPLTILNITGNTELAIVEMGANHIGEIQRLCTIALPNIGIITNIGKAHLEGFGSIEGVVKAKNELFGFLKASAGSVIVNADDPLLMKLSDGIKRFTYGRIQADLTAEIVNHIPHLRLKWHLNGKEYECDSRLYGKYNFDNILAAIAAGLIFEIPRTQINAAIQQYTPSNNRSQILKTEKNNLVLDAYNANPVSMAEAILSFKEYGKENPLLILGDMFELGKSSSEEHQKIIQLLIETGFKKVVLVGDDFYNLKNESVFTSLQSTQDAVKYFKNNPVENANILIKGSRGIELEKLVNLL